MLIAIHLLVVVTLAIVGIIAGHRFSSSRRYWALGFILPLAVVTLVILGRRVIALSFMPPFSWVTAGHVSFAIMAAVCTMIFSTLIPRLKIARQRVLVSILMVAMMINFSVLPIVMPAVVRGSLLATNTRIDINGICRQMHDYTCGPAAAVTVLHRLGVDTKESEMAILAQTSPAGTDADVLTAAINERFGPAGLHADYRLFDSMDELGRAVPAVALMHFNFLVDHYVAVLEVTPTGVLIGDPLYGRELLSRKEFADNWRWSAVVVSRKP